MESQAIAPVPNTAPKPFVFVLMPFDKSFDDVYKLGIKPASEAAGAYCERIDEQNFHGSIVGRIYNQIAKADIVVADMTGRNPNVFYEVGYAHALDKQVILATKDSDDIPFDLKHYPHIIYSGSISLLKEQLTNKLRWCVENPKGRIEVAERTLELYWHSESLRNSPIITLPSDGLIALDIHNPTSKTFPQHCTRIGVVYPVEFEIKAPITKANNTFYSQLKTVFLPKEEGFLALFPAFDVFLPFTWETLDFNVAIVENVSEVPAVSNWIFRVFSDTRALDYPVTMKLPKAQF